MSVENHTLISKIRLRSQLLIEFKETKIRIDSQEILEENFPREFVSKRKKHDKAKIIHAASVAIASRHSLYILYVCLAHENERVDARQTSRLSHSQTNRNNQNNAVRNSGTPRKRTRWLRARNFLCQLVDHLSHLSHLCWL